MADSMGPISSAVILPVEPEAPESPRAKRRQSSTSEDPSSKRPRLSHDGSSGSPGALRASPAAESTKQEPGTKQEAGEKAKDLNQERRKSSVQEERKRGQRLFGGLLSTLSQSTPNGQQKRRLEIEKRQAEKAQQQKHDDEVRRAEKLANLKKIRKAEQIKFDEESMRIRHSNILAMANFLCTKTEPKLYYKPWELLPRDEERIKTQIAEAEAIIEREVDEFYRQHPKESGTESRQEPGENTNGTSKETVGEPRFESPSVSSALVDTTNPSAHEKLSLEEHNGEVVVEAEEDTVIY